MKKIMYEQIYKDIINDIKEGILKEQDILPSEKELAEKYNVSRITTGKALSMLTERGIVMRIRGKGSFICKGAGKIISGEEKNISGNADMQPRIQKDMIGVIMDAFDLDFGTHLLKGIERECSRNDWGMMLKCTYGSAEMENKAIQEMLDCGCKGILLMTVQGEMYNEMILKLVLDKVPVVLLDREMKGLGIPCVKTDNYKATWELTETLINRGHRNICFVTHMYETTPTIAERSDAFRDCMLHDIRCSGSVRVLKNYQANPEQPIEAFDDYDLSEVEAVVLEEDCTAFISAEYKLGMMLQQACEKQGISRKICVFDDLYKVYNKGKYFTHVKQDEYQMGTSAVKMIKQIIDDEEHQMSIYIPYQIVE